MAERGDGKENVPVPPKRKKLSPSKSKELLTSKRRKLSLSLKKKSGHFGNTLEDILESLGTYNMPKKSADSSKWATKNLREWLEDYNSRNPMKKCPDDLLLPYCSKELLNKWLCVYVTETRNQNGDPYPPKSIYALLCGILRER